MSTSTDVRGDQPTGTKSAPAALKGPTGLEAGRGPLPLVIGITGHRDLREEDRPALEAQVEAIFTEFRERLPHTPLMLLSPLAEGADRLAARVALRCGVQLLAPLPMPQEEYQRDFEALDSRAEFQELLRQASHSFELPLLPGHTTESVRERLEHRNDQYALVGAYIVHHCQLLIALWNGISGREDGGTGQVVQFQQDGIPEILQAAFALVDSSTRMTLDPVEIGPVYQIVTPRRSQPEVDGEPLTLRRHYPGRGKEQHRAAATFERICANIDAFNQGAQAVEQDPQLRSTREKYAGYLLPDAKSESLPPFLSLLRQHYATADTLAIEFQRRTLRTLRHLCVLVFAGVLSFEVSAKLAPDNGWLALVFPVLLGITYLYWYSTVRKSHWQDRHQDYRALAEGLRVQFFWRLAGLPTAVADHYLRKQRTELDWIRIAVRNLAGDYRQGPIPSNPSPPLDWVREHWVQDQGRYFARSAHRDHEELERYEVWINRLMVASPIVAAVTALVLIVPSPLGEWLHHQIYVHKLLIILVFLLAGVAGVLHTYVDKRALSQHAKQYERMATLFSLAEQHVDKHMAAGQQTEAQQILLELGREALGENGDWVLTHRERPVDVPHAG